MRVLDNIQPEEVWFWFEEICRIPRPSGQEKAIADFLVGFAKTRSLEVLRDDTDNVLIRCDGRGSASSHPPLLLQAHVDIVAEKTDDSNHNHSTDPIVPIIDGDWVTSPETTLGADNGIGVALMLAVLDSGEIPHPPLECLFTTDEERGLTGAASLDPSWIRSKRLINLDSEEEGSFTIGCAGGMDFILRMPLDRDTCQLDIYNLEIAGLKGGHSGMEIDKSRGNAISFLGRILGTLCSDSGCRIARVQGGTKRNAIPRSASAIIGIPCDEVDRVGEIVRSTALELQKEFQGIEEGIEVLLQPSSALIDVLSAETGKRLADLLLALPHGVMKMSGVIEGLVETSVNLALASTAEDVFTVELTARSSLESAKVALGQRINAVADMSGSSFEAGGGYPGWTPDSNSEMLGKIIGIYSDVTGREPGINTIHAGLECGIIGDRVGGLDMISMGPDIRDVHIPGERASISSLRRFWKFFRSLLESLN